MNFHLVKSQARQRKLTSFALSLLVLLSLNFLVVPDAEAACDNLGPYPAGQPIELIACTDGGPGSNIQSTTLAVPAGVQGDLLVAVIVVDSGNEVLVPPAGWTAIGANTQTLNSITSNVFTKPYDGEPANYTWTWSQSNERSYGYIISLRGASGLLEFATNTGNNSSPSIAAGAINTDEDGSLILYTGSFDHRDIVDNPGPAAIAPPHTGITQDRNGGGGGAVSGAGAYTYVATAGTNSPAASFSLTAGEQWIVRTIAFEPIQFNLSVDQATTSVCESSTQVTLRVEDSNGTPMDLFEGTVTITASGANAGTSVWTDPNSAVTSSASAVYTFDANDNGVAVFDYANAAVGALTFDVSFDNFTATTTAALTIQPCEFRISYADGQMGVCSREDITVSLVNAVTGTPATDYSGTVTINNGEGRGFYASGASGFSNGLAGVASFDLSITGGVGTNSAVLSYADTAVDPLVNFNITEDSGLGLTENSGNPTDDPNLAVNACEFRISYPAAQMGTCANHDITVSLVDAGTGDPATDYSGTVTITNNEARGSYSSAATNFANGSAGVASFDLDITAGVGSSSAVLSYTDTTLDPLVNFDISEDSGAGITEPNGDPTDDPNLAVQACEIWVEVVDGANESDVCTIGAITFSIRAGGAIVQGYDGNLIISTSSGQGVWSGGAGGLINNGGGSATYNFVPLTDLGQANLGLYHPFTGSVNFTVSGTAGNGAILGPAAGNVDTLTVVSCRVEITRDSATSDVCSNGQIITYEIQDRDGNQVANYAGTIIIRSQKDPASPVIYKGNWEYDASATDPPVSGAQLTNGATDDGFATLQFVAGDGGSIDVRYVNENLGDWDLKIGTPGFVVAGGSTADIEVSPCYFYIFYVDEADTDDGTPGESDVCSIETVTIRLVNAAGTPITTANYEGTVNISTSGAGGGTWSDIGLSNAGSLAPGPAESGIAVYEFAIADAGEVTLEFTSLTSGIRNINVSDGTTTDLGSVDAPNDPSLSVDLCEFWISYTGGGLGVAGSGDYAPASVSACSFQDVTIEIRDRLDALATNFTGDIKVTVPLNKGDWSSGLVADPPVGGSFSNGTADDGEMTYTFVAGDNGSVDFRFTSLGANDYNFEIQNVVSGIGGEIVENSAADPTLTITSCFPTLFSSSCSGRNDQNADGDGDPDTVDIGIPAVSSLLDRIIIAIAAQEGLGNTPNTPTIDNQPMNLLHREQDSSAPGNTLEMWYLLDSPSTLPGAAGTYQGEFAGAVGNWGFCFLSLSEVAQVLPAFNVGDPTAGTLNYNNSNFNGTTELMETTVTTTVNNSFLVAATSSADAQNNWAFEDVSPKPPLARFVGDNDTFNPAYALGTEAQFAGSYGVSPIASSITYSESEDDYSPAVNTQIVAVFEPRVPGPPIAVDYEPVKLFQTYSGNLSYKAFGASLRPGPAACTFVNNPGSTSGGTTESTLTLPGLPGDSTVTAAWLYWFGSGSDDGGANGGITGTDSQVTLIKGLGDVDEISIPVDATEMFIINNVGTAGTVDYFAGYAEVSGFVNESEDYAITDLNIDFGTPWSSSNACAGGWAIIVVYENDNEQLRVLNLFQGFQPFQRSAFTLVPRNFRMASPSGALPFDGNYPNGQITHVTVEGDYELANGDESLGIQVAPGSASYTTLLTPFNPTQAEFNSTITRPVFSLQSTVDGDKYLIDATNPLSQNNVIEEYEIDFPFDNPMPGPLASPPAPPPPPNTYYQAGDQVGTSYGVDIDTHYLQGADTGETLYQFALAEAEEITTRYSSGQDLVLLVSEVISVTNAALADIEIFKTGPVTATVNTTQDYIINVTNNGDGASGGYADGQIIVTDILPEGMTFDTVGADVTGLDWACTETAMGVDPGAFTCIYEIADDYDYVAGTSAFAPDPDPGPEYFPATAARLGEGEFLPPITASVKIDPTVFTAQTTDVINVARVLHTRGGCTISGTPGISPDPATCTDLPKAQFDNVNDLQGGILDLNNLDEKTDRNNNVSEFSTEVRGIETDLSITKTLIGVLEAGESAQYRITVTNNGPDITTTAFTVTDTIPTLLTFDSIDAIASDDELACSITAALNCTFNGPGSGTGLGVGASVSVYVNITVDPDPGSTGETITNIATVATAAGNFDPNNSNNTGSSIEEVIPPPAETTERFLLSVSEDNITLGGLPFGKDDLVLYNPETDTATPFFIDDDEAEIDVNDINAVHLLQNGQIAMSVNGASTADDIPGGFGPEDIVVWDPILKTTTLLFEGTGKFDEVENIDAVYILENGDIVFSTVDSGSWNSDAVEWDKSDLLRWDVSTGTVTKYLDGGDATVFGSEDAAQVDAVYVRVADGNANAVKNTFWLSASTDPLGGTVNAGTTAGTFGNAFGQDDLLELADPNSEIAASGSSEGNLLFSGNTPLGEFTGAASSTNRIDGVHIVEDGYHGHFSIVEDQGGTTCAPGRIRISKHLGLSHLVDTGYTGSITIGSSTGMGSWSINSGSGTLNNEPNGMGTNDDGDAIYTFVLGDMGSVVLNFTTGAAGSPQSFNIDVSNTIVRELDAEDEDFDFFDEITGVSFLDTFQSVSYARNDGLSSWAAAWVDVDDLTAGGGEEGFGPNVGNIRVESNKLSITASSGVGANPSISRFAEFTNFAPTEDVFLNFDYTYSNLNSADAIIVDVSDDEGMSWDTLKTYTGISGTNLVSPIAESLNISDLVPAGDFSGGVTVRARVSAGYLLSSKFFMDNIEIATGTNACGVGSIGHYAIYIDGTASGNTGPSTTEFDGISCLGSLITIQGHNGADSLVAPGETITLQSSTNKGSWTRYLSENPINDTGTNVDGQMQYTFGITETSATFRFNYTNPTADNEKVNFNVVSPNAYPVLSSEDPTLNVRLAGLRFFNETGGVPGIPNQIASKPSDAGYKAATISLQAVRSSDQDPQQCVPLFDNGTTLDFEFALECVDPLGCAAEEAGDDLDAYVNDQLISRVTDNGGDGVGLDGETGYGAEFAIPLITQVSGDPGGTIKFEYKDAGDVILNARWEITLDNNPLGLTVGDYLTGATAFNVRPFGLDIDFSEERYSATVAGGGTDINTLNSYADDADDTVFATAGLPFTTRVSAVGWQAEDDDADNDGIPDADADLSDNQVTRNFGNEGTNLEYDVLVTLNQVVAPTDGVGVLTDSRIANFGNGDADVDMIFDEVGIIDLDARLVQNNLTTDDTFMGLDSGVDPGSVLRGAVKNVGRFVPNDFVLTVGSITNRSLARIQPSCSAPTSNFTYMGEQFGFSATVTARNGLASPTTTKNYVGAYAKLNGADFPASRFAAVDQLDNNADLSARMADGPDGANRMVMWGTDPGSDGGSATLTGDLVFNRDSGVGNEQPEDGPYTALTLGLLDTVVSTEYAGVTRPFVLDLDRGNDASDDATAIADAEFRYGRLILENAFGPETEPLQIAFRVEYWDDDTMDWLLNVDDSCTTIEFDSATDLTDSERTDERSIRLLDGDNGLLESFEGNLDDGEIEIEALATGATPKQNVFVGIVNGETAAPLATPSPAIDDFETDRLMEVTAPGENNDGAVYLEFNLSDPDLGFSLDFLSYDWRNDGELDDENDSANANTNGHTDNPRARFEFGSYRGHDRVINWQEIYIGPSQ